MVSPDDGSLIRRDWRGPILRPTNLNAQGQGRVTRLAITGATKGGTSQTTAMAGVEGPGLLANPSGGMSLVLP